MNNSLSISWVSTGRFFGIRLCRYTCYRYSYSRSNLLLGRGQDLGFFKKDESLSTLSTCRVSLANPETIVREKNEEDVLSPTEMIYDGEKNERNNGQRFERVGLSNQSKDSMNGDFEILNEPAVFSQQDLQNNKLISNKEPEQAKADSENTNTKDFQIILNAPPSNKKQSRKERTPPKKPDDRNDDIVDSIVRYFGGDGEKSSSGGSSRSGSSAGEDNPQITERANVQLPPGWGKTQLALQTMAALFRNGIGPNGQRLQSAIYVTPQLNLVDQVVDQIDQFGALDKVPHERLIVASQTNQTHARTTNTDEIAAFLASSWGRHGRVALLISTYASLPKVGKALAMLNSSSRSSGGKDASIGIAIFDEAHCMEGAGTRSGYGLYDKNLPVDNRLFLTATPRRYIPNPKVLPVLGSKLTEDGSRKLIVKHDAETIKRLRHSTEVRSIMDKTLFGPCIASRTMKESVEKKITVPITLVALDRDEVQSLLGITESEYDKHSMLPFAIHAAFTKLKTSHAVSFHSMNNRARSFVEVARPVFGKNITVFRVDSTLKASEREAIMSQAKTASASVIANCRLLHTGVDEANWDLVVMADPVPSPVTSRQMIGRVTRPSPGKERGYVLVPTLMEKDESSQVDELLFGNGKGYETFRFAFEAMVGLDPELRQDVAFITEETIRLGRPLRDREFPTRLLDAFMLPPSLSLQAKTDIMNQVIIEVGNDNIWEEKFSLLEQFKEREGHCNVHRKQIEDGMKLGDWLINQRQAMKSGELDHSRRKRMEDLGVVWDVLEGQWEQMFLLLEQFKEREGHCNIPGRQIEDGMKLGKWLNRQRQAMKSGELDQSRRKRMEDLGVVWDVLGGQWEQMFSLLERFKEREGHCNVRFKHVEDGMQLGQWLYTQRKAMKSGKLDQSRWC